MRINLAVITCCMYPDTSRIHYLQESCDKQGIFLLPHGIGATFAGWANALISQTLPAMMELKREGYTHVLYTDGSDSIIITPQDEIISKYQHLGEPSCLMSSDCECFPPLNGESFPPTETRWRYVNGGGYIAEIGFFISVMTKLAQKYSTDGNHQSWIVQEWPIPGFRLDSNCEIFQPMDDSVEFEVIRNSDPKEKWARIINLETLSFPNVLHFRGGFSDPATGRDFRIETVWRRLYEGGN